MNPKQLFDSGNLSGAIEALTQEVKAHPSDATRRTFLFELLAFAGELDRADKQLDVISHQDVQSEWATQVYVNILHAERSRSRLYAEGLEPEFLLEPPDYIRWHVQAIACLRENRLDEARSLLDQSEEARPTVRGNVDDRPFDEFRDCDDLLAPVLELILIRDYIWLPTEQVRELEISRPERPRDLLWAPVRVVLSDGTQRRAYMPALYHASYKHPDDLVKLGRMTDWVGSTEGPMTGVGLRQFLVGDEARAVFELPPVTFAP